MLIFKNVRILFHFVIALFIYLNMILIRMMKEDLQKNKLMML